MPTQEIGVWGWHKWSHTLRSGWMSGGGVSTFCAMQQQPLYFPLASWMDALIQANASIQKRVRVHVPHSLLCSACKHAYKNPSALRVQSTITLPPGIFQWAQHTMPYYLPIHL